MVFELFRVYHTYRAVLVVYPEVALVLLVSGLAHKVCNQPVVVECVVHLDLIYRYAGHVGCDLCIWLTGEQEQQCMLMAMSANMAIASKVDFRVISLIYF